MRSFGIKNFRSFDEDGIYLKNIKKLNIFIGKNNSGKSTVLRFLKYLSESIKQNKLHNFPSEIHEEHKRNGQKTSFIIPFSHEELNFPDIKAHILDPFEIEFRFKDSQMNGMSLFDSLNASQLNKCINIKNSDIYQYDSRVIGQLKMRLEDRLKASMAEIIKKEFKDVIYIPHFRTIGRTFDGNLSEINGSDIISKMFEMQHPSVGQEAKQKQFFKIENFIKELLKVETLEMEIPHTRDNILINMHGNRLPLDSFGTGIHQLVILCSALVMNDNKIVCIEEPEVYLHPELQRMFLDFLIKETNHTYFISTHSNVFIDFNQDIQVNHVTYDGISTKIEQINESNSAKNILDDLGYKNSDLLQSNGIIWVEGPSDRAYINKWISLLRDDLEEGLHYTIMFYGGKLLSHLSFTPREYTIANKDFLENELIDLMRINKNSFVVIDRDGVSSSVAIRGTKQRIKDEIGDNLCWITKGREIENYLTANTLEKWLDDKYRRNGNIQYSRDDKLEVTVSKLNSKIKYNLKKSQYSKEISEYINEDDLNILDLKKNIEHLIELIDEWNK
ncbi:ATP-dependent nuclease [Sulfurimonas sp.]|uniref:ATP-dependent nuclease n=1 Tax=Sulfurimonas sp. TaxID=2022749 RepID=UPI003D0E3AED